MTKLRNIEEQNLLSIVVVLFTTDEQLKNSFVCAHNSPQYKKMNTKKRMYSISCYNLNKKLCSTSNKRSMNSTSIPLCIESRERKKNIQNKNLYNFFDAKSGTRERIRVRERVAMVVILQWDKVSCLNKLRSYNNKEHTFVLTR
jgi:hypothetical protein